MFDHPTLTRINSVTTWDLVPEWGDLGREAPRPTPSCLARLCAAPWEAWFVCDCPACTSTGWPQTSPSLPLQLLPTWFSGCTPATREWRLDLGTRSEWVSLQAQAVGALRIHKDSEGLPASMSLGYSYFSMGRVRVVDTEAHVRSGIPFLRSKGERVILSQIQKVYFMYIQFKECTPPPSSLFLLPSTTKILNLGQSFPCLTS